MARNSNVVSIVVDNTMIRRLLNDKLIWESAHGVELSKSAFYRMVLVQGLEDVEKELRQIMEAVYDENDRVLEEFKRGTGLS